MKNKYIVQLTTSERQLLQEVIRKHFGSAIKVKRADILLKVDHKGPGWTDEPVTEAFNCTVQTVLNVRRHLVTLGFEAAVEKKHHPNHCARKL